MTEPTTQQNSTQQALQQVRSEIDALDAQIQTLINHRAQCAMRVADIKKQAAPDTPIDFFRPEREAEVLRNVMARNQGPIENEEMARLFRQIMSSCLALEQTLTIAYLGPAGTFTQQAALKHFGHAVQTRPLGTIDEVFREVEAGAVNFAVVPVENSTEGMVNTTLDAFMDSQVKICGEVALRIHQHLLVSENTKPSQITRIYSHPQSLAQCRRWLDNHFPGIERVAVSSNADAAKRIRGEWHAAAIAGDMAAEMYGLIKHADNIEDNPNNTTRFLVIGHQKISPTGDDKTSIIVSTRNTPGALYHLLEPFEKAGISLTRIETRPSRSGVWAYVFFIDFEGHQDHAAIESVLTQIETSGAELKRLGSYPRAVL
jgi:chorismate mutase/prephenate dehydratase